MRLACAAWLLVLGAAFSGPAAGADWEVKRQGNDALVEQAMRALLADPDRPELAARTVRMAGKARVAALLETAKRAADAAPGRYQPRARYAQLLLAAGKGAEAATAFGEALQLEPASGAAAAGRAHALALGDDRPAALAAFDEALRREKRSKPRVALLRALVQFASRVGAAEQELSARRQLLALVPGDARERMAVAQALARAGRPGEGADVLRELLDGGRLSGGGRAEVLSEIAKLAEAAGDDEAAERALRQLLRLATSPPERTDVYRRIVDVARRRDTLEPLERTLSKAVATTAARKAPEWEALARVRESLGDLMGALDAGRRAAALDPANTETRRQVLGLLERLGLDQELMATYDDLERRYPEDPTFVLERIERKFRQRERDDARARFDRALRAFRRSGDTLAKLADLASRWSEDERVLAAWDAALALSPRDERAIVGLGEAHFQRGRRELARRTWRGLLAAVQPRADGHARLAELLGDHDLIDDAIAEARTAQKLEPANPHHHRTLARILERKKDHVGAIAEWRAVLAKSQGAARTAERREARANLVTLLSREGRPRVEAEADNLRNHLKKHLEDRETTLFLADIETRLMDPERAITTLKAAAERWPGDADVTGALVRLLRQSRQLGEAARYLEAFAARAPTRARDAFIQLAEIELGRYDDARALEFAARASALAADDADALVRVADIEDRAGRSDRALETYRRALARGPSARAASALFRVLIRHGRGEEASAVLRAFALGTADAETRADMLRREIEVAEYLRTFADLERVVVSVSARGGSAQRKVAAQILERMVPRAYQRAAHDPAAAAERSRLGRWGLRPLLELVTERDAEPDAAIVSIIGMLGNRNATPVLARIAQGPPPAAPARQRGSARVGAAASQLAAALALGRVGDPRAMATLKELSAAADASLRAAAVWALGRLADPGAAATMEEALADPRGDVVAVACLGVGRQRSARGVRLLERMVADLGNSARIRRAAVLGLGLAEAHDASATLVPLLDAPDPALARAAAAALGAIRDRRALPALFQRALLARGSAETAAVVALRRFAAPGGLPDEALALGDRGRIDVDALLDALSTPATPTPGELQALWLEHANELRDVLARALQGSADGKRRALTALDARADGPGLGPLAAGPLSAAGLTAVRDATEPLRDRVVALLDDPDAELRRTAVRVAAKLRDRRIGPGHLQALVAAVPAGGRADPEATAVLVARLQLEAGRLNGTALVQAMRPLLTAPAWERRLLALRVARLAGPVALPEIERAVHDPNGFVRAEAVTALGEHASATGTLIRAARDPLAAVRETAARALVARRGRGVDEALATLARDEVEAVRVAAKRPAR